MRRIWVMLLVAVCSFTLVDPGVFIARAERKLPACCRANGRHHCAAPAGAPDSTPSFQAGPCASFNGSQTTAPLPTFGTMKPAQGIFAAVVSHPTPRAQVAALGRVSFDRSALKRGPPSA